MPGAEASTMGVLRGTMGTGVLKAGASAAGATGATTVGGFSDVTDGLSGAGAASTIGM
jgi:hypothetical protein